MTLAQAVRHYCRLRDIATRADVPPSQTAHLWAEVEDARNLMRRLAFCPACNAGDTVANCTCDDSD